MPRTYCSPLRCHGLVVLLLMLVGLHPCLAADPGKALNEVADGYRGVWYQNQRLGGEYVFKYSGGLATYCAKHSPFAFYCPDVQRAYFCYGGVDAGYSDRYFETLSTRNIDTPKPEDALLHMVSYFDHKNGTVPRPTVLLNKHTHDAHDNPVISVDDQGYIWILSTAHGTLRSAYVHRSVRPHDVSEFERVHPYRMEDGKKVLVTNFSYMQVHRIPEKGFAYFFTSYQHGRQAHFGFSRDGVGWSWIRIAGMQQGHYQISTVRGNTAASAFNYHPTRFRGEKKGGLNWRTNLYYMETPDFGETWRTADGTLLEVPLEDPQSAALIHDYEKEGLLVYMKDLQLDAEGRPLILFITSKGYTLGPENDPRTWRLARWTGSEWLIHDITTSDNNYDMGSLYLDGDGSLRVIAPTETGPQPYNPGGEVAVWVSHDQGATWNEERQLTSGSPHNHTYVRRPINVHPDFQAFWADGHGRQPSAVRLFFSNARGEVFQLPASMTRDHETPLLVP